MPQNLSFSPMLVSANGPSEFTPLFDHVRAPAVFSATVATSSAPAAPELLAPPTAPTPEELLQQAQQRAEEIVARAQAEARVLAAEQVATALAGEGQKQTEAFAAAARGLLAQLHQEWEAHLAYLEREAAGLVVEIARRVLHERFESDEQAIIPVVREALRPLAEDQRVRVVVAPTHGAALQDAYAQLAQVLKDSAHLDIVLSETAEPGGCVVHAESGSIDARLDNRLRILEETVQENIVSATAA